MYTVKLNGNQQHIKSNSYSAGENTLYSIVLDLWNKFGYNDPPTQETVLAAIDGDAFEIGNPDYTISITKD